MNQNLLELSFRKSNAIITLNRAEKRNALNEQMVTLLIDALEKAGENDKVRSIILKANGEVFSAGADLAYLEQLQQNSFDENLADSQHLMTLFMLMYNFPKPIIAQVEGHAIAGGCGLATVCDFVFAVPEAKFGYTEVKIGFIPALVSVFLFRKIGLTKAKELLLTAKLLEAKEAKDYGMINDIYLREDIDEQVEKFADRLAKQCSGNSLKLTKDLLNKVQDMNFKDAMYLAAHSNAEARGSADCMKGINAFLNKEKLEW